MTSKQFSIGQQISAERLDRNKTSKKISNKRWRYHEVIPGVNRGILAKFKCKYRVTLVVLLMLLDQQGWKCAICGQGFDLAAKGKDPRNPHIDHCHSTGALRGLLCNTCNSSIGKLGDNVAGLMRAVEYLKKNQEE